MQFDADEDGEPFFKPPAISSAPPIASDKQPATAQQRPLSAGADIGSTDQAAAAAATAEQEE